MSNETAPLQHVLSRPEVRHAALLEMRSQELKSAARFWIGKETYKLNKDQCARALAQALSEPTRIGAALRSLPEAQQLVLRLFRRYGGSLPGPVLLSELRARGLRRDQDRDFLTRPKDDVIQDLYAKLLLIEPGERRPRSDFLYRIQNPHYAYPDVALLPAVSELVDPIEALPWPTTAAPAPAETVRRSPAEVAVDLALVTDALATGAWKATRTGVLARNAQVKLEKLCADASDDPLVPPAPAVLYFEILRGLHAVELHHESIHLNPAGVARLRTEPVAMQGWQWVRAWLQAQHWEDGVGATSRQDEYRFSHSTLHTRALLAWALSRVAHSPDHWLNLESFLVDLWSVNRDQSPVIYCRATAWQPVFIRRHPATADRDDPQRLLRYWMGTTGMWIAHGLGTLTHLGLIERGRDGPPPDGVDRFRLTALGRVVFGAPDLAVPQDRGEQRFVTVQPNHEVVAYLDGADPGAAATLAHLAQRASAARGLVQTYSLSRASVYRAQESGLSIEEIRAFFAEHSRTALPDNVARSLQEWARGRDALSLGSNVILGLFPPAEENLFAERPQARRISPGAVVLDAKEAASVRHIKHSHDGRLPLPCWSVAEDGRVAVQPQANALAQARLTQFAEADEVGWRITAASVRRAFDRGTSLEQIRGWLKAHVVPPMPLLIAVALQNWVRPSPAFLGDVLLLQVPREHAVAVLASQRFEPLVLGHVPPDTFVVRAEKRAELKRLLTELGFALDACYRLRGPEPSES